MVVVIVPAEESVGAGVMATEVVRLDDVVVERVLGWLANTPPLGAAAAAQLPVKDPELLGTNGLLMTSGPGFGNCTSFPSTVVQPFPIFASNIAGREANGVAGALPVPVIVTEAQFM